MERQKALTIGLTDLQHMKCSMPDSASQRAWGYPTQLNC